MLVLKSRNFAIAIQAVERMHLLFKVKGLVYNVHLCIYLTHCSQRVQIGKGIILHIFSPQFLKNKKENNCYKNIVTKRVADFPYRESQLFSCLPERGVCQGMRPACWRRRTQRCREHYVQEGERFVL
jgi:hypothetical protein